MNKNLYGLHLYGLQGNGAPDRLIKLNDFKIIDDISYEKLLNKHLVFVFGTKDGNISRSLMRKKLCIKDVRISLTKLWKLTIQNIMLIEKRQMTFWNNILN